MNDRTSSYRRILKSSSIIGGASVANVVIGVLRTKILAILLGPAGVGITSLYTGLITTASGFAQMGVGTVGTRQIAEACSRDDKRSLLVARRAMFWGTLFLASSGALIVWLFRFLIATWVLGNASQSGTVGWLALGVAFSVAGAAQGALIQGMRRIADIARLSVYGSIFSTILGVGLLWWWRGAGLVAYVVISPVVSFILGHIYVSRLPKVEEDNVSIQELSMQWVTLLRLGLAFVCAGLSTSLIQLWIRIYIAKKLGAVALGQYQAAWIITMQYSSFVLAAMGADYYPRLTGLIHEHKAAVHLVNEQTEIAVLLSSPVFIAMMAIAPWVVHILYTRSFTPAVEILRWQILGDVLKVLSWSLGYLILAAGDAKTFFWSESGVTLITAGVIVGLVPVIGLRATGISYAVCYVIHVPIVYWIARRKIGFRWENSVLLISSVSFVLCVAVGILAIVSQWAGLVGIIIAVIFTVYSIGRVTYMSNVDGPIGAAGKFARLITRSDSA